MLHQFAMLDLDGPVRPARSRVINGLVQAETKARTTELDAAIDALRAQIARWSGAETFVVCDTNFYLKSATPFGDPGFAAPFGLHLHGVRIIVPMVVVEELDRAKLGRDEFRGRAQVSLARLDNLFQSPTAVVDLEPKVVQAVDVPISGPFGGATIELLFDPPGHMRMASADSEIIERALMVQGLAARSVTLVTHDTNMSMKARVAGLEVIKVAEPPRPPSQRQPRRNRLAGADEARRTGPTGATASADVQG
jgi:rRNA-processing protein FCF1